METSQQYNNPKKKKSISLKDFRDIHIYEADWNTIMSIKWKQALQKSEVIGMIQPNQFGSHNSNFRDLAENNIDKLIMMKEHVTTGLFRTWPLYRIMNMEF
jgi:hypothetical protein